FDTGCCHTYTLKLNDDAFVRIGLGRGRASNVARGDDGRLNVRRVVVDRRTYARILNLKSALVFDELTVNVHSISSMRNVREHVWVVSDLDAGKLPVRNCVILNPKRAKG